MNPFTWDKKTGRYRRPNGTFVSLKEIQSLIDRILDKQLRSTRDLAILLRESGVSLAVWRQLMRDMIKNVHLFNAAAAKGGWGQLTQADYGRIGNIVRKEYGFLERFVTGIAEGRTSFDGTFISRAMLYVEAGRDTYYQVLRSVMQTAGFREERNLLHATESCSGCKGETTRGWVKIGKLIPIGRRICLRRCRCSLEFRQQG